jgi:toluene monooxygenase system protein E
VTRQRTYWHLDRLGRKPSEYDITSSRLLYGAERGCELRTPLGDWQRAQAGALGLRCRDWERFRDPRATTYTRYTELQRDKETFVDGLLATIEATGYDRRLTAAWLSALERVLGPLRYPVHALQMLAAYVGAAAPCGKLVITAALQSADEIRRVQRLAYRLRQIQTTQPGFGEQSLASWQRDPRWQPLRRLLEHALVAYDWGEAFVALNALIKPVLLSLHEDCIWHRGWSGALIAMLIEDDPANARVMATWVERWHALTQAAVDGAATLLELPPNRAGRPSATEIASRVHRHVREYLTSLGLELRVAREAAS